MIQGMFRAVVVAAAMVLAPIAAARAEDAAALARALQAAGAKDWATAQDVARGSGPLSFDIVEWHRLRAGEGTFADYADFVTRRGDWPGMDLLRRRGEAKLDGVAADQVVGYFANRAPLTGAGALALVAAHQARGEAGKAATVAEAAWRGLVMEARDQEAFLQRYPDLVAPHHGGRIAAMLERGQRDQAQRILPFATPGTRAVAEARIALQANRGGVDSLIAAVPERMLGSAGLALDRAKWRWRNGAEAAAAELLLERSVDADRLGAPHLWAGLRASLARWDLRQGDARRAYMIAARHRLPAEGADYADLEWLAGYAALKLGDGPTALRHFEALGAVVQSPISLSRAGYWKGRALEAMGKAEAAQAAYRDAARYQTAFYGLLAAERAGLPLDPAFAAPPPLPDWRGAGFAEASVFQAAVLLKAAGHDELAQRFILHLSEGLGAEDVARLARLALEWNDPHLALGLGKRAAETGAMLVAAYYPLSGIETLDLGVPAELALAIARRESEFDPAVVSPAGARGLMQVMPGTAKMMADRLGIAYEADRLTRDPGYNARLGAAYLGVLRAEFGTSPVLVAAGYNAGPGRPRRWVEERGDPRNPTVDVVDWIEMIPFTETRNYVMRVAESLPIYRARLGQADAGPLRFSAELRGLPPAR
ncbi:lytic transglycosylase domain-containing protein [Phaeovulum sp. NW3]|uniref:lytic transglycosylase domain-containing protein n=1 Tax=Phaeovulum sp. NW3 TaxID=2934933 RepID=UPI0024C3F904|nr:lytic transglycosylase domain-containing protein [Phaeovulum sp. NW3]